MACVSPQCTLNITSPLQEARQCPGCGQKMGYIGGRRGFGLRQQGHWDRCRARKQRWVPKATSNTKVDSQLPSDSLLGAPVTFTKKPANGVAEALRNHVIQLQLAGVDAGPIEKMLARQPLADVFPHYEKVVTDIVTLNETLSNQVETLDLQSRSHPAADDAGMRQEVEAAKQIGEILKANYQSLLRKHVMLSCEALRNGPIDTAFAVDSFAQHETVVMEIVVQNQNLKSQADALRQEQCSQAVADDSLQQELDAVKEANNIVKANYKLLLDKHEVLRCETEDVKEENEDVNHVNEENEKDFKQASAGAKVEREVVEPSQDCIISDQQAESFVLASQLH